MSDENAPADPLAIYVAHLWGRKWLIFSFCVFVVAVTCGLLLTVVPESYIARAHLFIKDKQYSSSIERDALSPISYESLLLSDDLLFKVREQMAEAAGASSGAALIRFDLFKRLFSIESKTDADTTVRRDYSPIIGMAAQWHSGDGAQQVMDIWTQTFVRDFGSLLTNEATSRVAAHKRKYDDTMRRLEASEADRSKVETQLRYKRRLLVYSENLLAPAVIPNAAAINSYPLPQPQGSSMIIDSSSLEITEAKTEGPGLLAEAMRLEIELGARGGEAETGELTRELVAVKGAIAELETRIAVLQDETAELDKRYSTLVEEVRGAKTELQIYSLNIAQVSLGLERPEDEELSEYEGSDVRIVSSPIAPDFRSWPKRRVVVMLTAAIAFLSALLFVVGEKYLRDALKSVSNS